MYQKAPKTEQRLMKMQEELGGQTLLGLCIPRLHFRLRGLLLTCAKACRRDITSQEPR
jgi:hypothetical protein